MFCVFKVVFCKAGGAELLVRYNQLIMFNRMHENIIHYEQNGCFLNPLSDIFSVYTAPLIIFKTESIQQLFLEV